MKVLLVFLITLASTAASHASKDRGGNNGYACFLRTPNSPGLYKKQFLAGRKVLTAELSAKIAWIKSYDLILAEKSSAGKGELKGLYPYDPREVKSPKEYAWKIARRFTYKVPIIETIFSEADSLIVQDFGDGKRPSSSSASGYQFEVSDQDDGNEVIIPDRENCFKVTLAVQHTVGKRTSIAFINPAGSSLS
jgi:hypothetical protein